MSKSNVNSENFKVSARIDLHNVDPAKFKELFSRWSVFDSVMTQADFDHLIGLFFRVSILISDFDLDKDNRSFILMMLEGFHTLGRKIIEAGGIDKMEDKVLLSEFLNSHIIGYILNLEELSKIAVNIFLVMECIGEDDLAFDQKEKSTIFTRFQSLLFFIDELIRLEVNEKESV